MSQTILLGLLAAGGILMIAVGLARTPSSSAADMVQERLQAYGGGTSGKPMTEDEIVLQKPFTERVLRPFILNLGNRFSRSTPEKARNDLQNRLNLAGRPGNLGPSEFIAVRYVAAVVMFAIGLLIGLLTGNPTFIAVGAAVGGILRLQSDEMRRKRRQRAQEKAAQASLKMMLPMVGCIFPTLWIILLGPAILIILKAKGS